MSVMVMQIHIINNFFGVISNHYLRKQWIHGARTLPHRTKGKTDTLSVWIQQIVEPQEKNKAVVAIANRLDQLVWMLLQRNKYYRVTYIGLKRKSIK